MTAPERHTTPHPGVLPAAAAESWHHRRVTGAEPNTNERPPTAVILTTFDAESIAVAAHFVEPPRERRTVDVRGTLYEVGTVSTASRPWSLALAEMGPGNTTAGVELERANAHWSPDVMLLVGVAGGLKDLRHGDVVAAEAVYDYESGKETGTGYLPRMKTHPSSHRLLQHARLIARRDAWPDTLPVCDGDQRPVAVVKPIAAGGKLLASDRSTTVKLLQRNCSDAVAVEMEGHGFLRGAYLNSGLEALVIRGISDLLADKTGDNDLQWQPIAARNAAAFAVELLSALTVTGRADRSTGPTSQPGVTITDSQGVQVGDNNVQHNTWESS